MEIFGQATLIHVCLGVYTIHMISIPILMSLGVIELHKQRRMLSDEFAVKPTKWEYWGVRFFLGFVLADAVRGYDGLFDNEQDGTVRSVWSLNPCSVRFFAWWFRDTCLFIASYIPYVRKIKLLSIRQCSRRCGHQLLSDSCRSSPVVRLCHCQSLPPSVS